MIFMVERTTRRVRNILANLRWIFVFRKRVTINRSVYINPSARCRFGSNLSIDTKAVICSELNDGWMTCGDNVQINRGAWLDISGGLRIGNRVMISSEAVIYTHSHGKDPRSEPIGIEKRIGEDVWIGSRAIVLPCVRDIGNGAIVGAGAVVSRDVQPNEIVVGNPARPLKR